jgi:hypothetical protein
VREKPGFHYCKLHQTRHFHLDDVVVHDFNYFFNEFSTAKFDTSVLAGGSQAQGLVPHAL